MITHKRLVYAIVIAILTVGIISYGLVAHLNGRTQPPSVQVDIPRVTSTPEGRAPDAKVSDALVKWVLEHSDKISRGQAKEIVEGVLKTNKALLILALIEVESTYNPTATSNKGARGLTQVMPSVWEKHLIQKGIIKDGRDLYEIRASIASADEVLTIFLKETKGDVEAALTKYLGGRDGWYVKKIFTHLANLYILTEGSK